MTFGHTSSASPACRMQARLPWGCSLGSPQPSCPASKIITTSAGAHAEGQAAIGLLVRLPKGHPAALVACQLVQRLVAREHAHHMVPRAQQGGEGQVDQLLRGRHYDLPATGRKAWHWDLNATRGQQGLRESICLKQCLLQKELRHAQLMQAPAPAAQRCRGCRSPAAALECPASLWARH